MTQTEQDLYFATYMRVLDTYVDINLASRAAQEAVIEWHRFNKSSRFWHRLGRSLGLLDD